MPDDTQTLDGVDLLADLDDDSRAHLTSMCAWRTYRPHQEIISKENAARDVYFVATGRVRVVNWSHGGREVSFEDIPAGGCFGELAAIDGGARSATVIALENTTVGHVASDIFLDVVLNDPATAKHLLLRLTAIIRRSTERIFDLSVFGANMRIYAALLDMAKPGLRDDNSAVISPIPIHADIAARVSTTRETVARVLSDLARQELVVREKDRLIVSDIDRLADLIEE